MNNFKKRGIGAVLSILVIVMLVMLGPASAFRFDSVFHDEVVAQGDETEFKVSFKMDGHDELVPLTEFHFILKSPNHVHECIFDVNGSAISGCEGMKIDPSPANNPEYGYGYGYGSFDETAYEFGYGYGLSKHLRYKITVDTNILKPGIYQVIFGALIDGELFSSTERDKITIVGPPAAEDLDQDGDVDREDLEILLGLWGPVKNSNEVDADFNNDGVINGYDLAILLGAWTQ